MDESRPKALALSLRERMSLSEAEAQAAPLFDRDDLRLFGGAFVAGFLFFLIWLG